MECHPCASLRRHCSPPAINPCLAILVRLNDPPVNDYTRLFSYSLKFQQFREACAKNSSTASERTGPSDSTRVVAISTSPKFVSLSLCTRKIDGLDGNIESRTSFHSPVYQRHVPEYSASGREPISRMGSEQNPRQ